MGHLPALCLPHCTFLAVFPRQQSFPSIQSEADVMAVTGKELKGKSFIVSGNG